jgi:hypothetical protein
MKTKDELIDDLLTLAFAEDVGDGDHTTLSTIPADAMGKQRLIVKEPGIIAGVEMAKNVFNKFDPELKMTIFINDGAEVKPGDIAFEVEGKVRSLLQTERVMLNISSNSSYVVKTADRDEDCSDDAAKIRNLINSYIPKVPVLKVHTGQVIDFGGATVEILYTIEDLLPEPMLNVNNSSLVIRISMAGHKIMLLADTCYESGPLMTEMWGEHLRSDILQVAHHAQWPAEPELYHCIKAEVILIPAVREKLAEYLLIKEGTGTAKVFVGYAKDVYISGDAVEIIELPYTVRNNKHAVLIALNPELTNKIP